MEATTDGNTLTVLGGADFDSSRLPPNATVDWFDISLTFTPLTYDFPCKRLDVTGVTPPPAGCQFTFLPVGVLGGDRPDRSYAVSYSYRSTCGGIATWAGPSLRGVTITNTPPGTIPTNRDPHEGFFVVTVALEGRQCQSATIAVDTTTAPFQRIGSFVFKTLGCR
jgi:hypothetical protein